MDEAHPTRPRGRPKSLDRQKAIEAAMLVYLRDDSGSLSLHEVIRRVGISKPALCREFVVRMASSRPYSSCTEPR
jgi:AcrR family transcriptional regulator